MAGTHTTLPTVVDVMMVVVIRQYVKHKEEYKTSLVVIRRVE
jgi:hypothetical protein